MINSLNYKFFSFLFILMPFTFITGPFLPDLFLSLISLNFIYLTIRHKLYDYYKSNFVLLFLIFYFYLIVRGLFTENIYISLIDYDGPIFYFRYLFFIIALTFYLKNPKIIKWFLYFLAISILFVCIDGYFQFFNTSNLFGMVTKDGNRLNGIFGKEQVLGHYLSYVLPLCIVLYAHLFQLKYDKKTIIFFLFIFAAFILSFISGDRTGFLKIFLFVFSAVFIIKNIRKVGLLFFLISSVIFFLLINFNPKSQERLNNTINDLSTNTYSFIPISRGHEELISVGFKIFQENIFFGKGPQAYRYLCSINENILYEINCTTHVHNYYVQILSELGFIGILPLLLAFLYLLKILMTYMYNLILKNSSPKYEKILMTSFLAITLLPIISHFNFYNNWINTMLFVSISFFFHFNNLKNDK